MNEHTKGHEDMSDTAGVKQQFKRGDAVRFSDDLGERLAVFIEYIGSGDYAVVDDSPTDPYLSSVPVTLLARVSDDELTPELLKSALFERSQVDDGKPLPPVTAQPAPDDRDATIERQQRELDAYAAAWVLIDNAVTRILKTNGAFVYADKLEDRAQTAARYVEGMIWRQQNERGEQTVLLKAIRLIVESIVNEYTTHAEKNARLRGVLSMLDTELNTRTAEPVTPPEPEDPNELPF